MQRTIKSRALSLLMVLALISTLFSGLTFSASAASIPITGGATISESGVYAVDDTKQGVITILPGLANVVLQGTGITSANALNGISILAQGEDELTIEDLYLASPYGTSAVIDFAKGANTLLFRGTSLLESNGINNGAIVHVFKNTILSITNDKGYDDAVLYIYKSTSSAAVGGNTGEACGTINFNGGTVLIKGSRTGPAVGGDDNTGVAANQNDTITFNGGNINIVTISQGAAIGASSRGDCAGPVVLNGGNLAVTTDFSGAAFGNGSGATAGGTLSVNGGSLEIVITSNSSQTPARVIASPVYDMTGALNPTPFPFVYTPASTTATTTVGVGTNPNFYSGTVNTWGFVRGLSSTTASWVQDVNSSIYLYVPNGTSSATIDGTSTPIYNVGFRYDFVSAKVAVDRYNPNTAVLTVDPLTFGVNPVFPYTATVSVTGGTLAGSDPYTLSNIQAGATVSVTSIPGATVTFVAPTGTTVYVNDLATTSAATAYNGSATFVVLPGAGNMVTGVATNVGAVAANTDGSYTVSGVTSDATVTITTGIDNNAWTNRADIGWYTAQQSPYTLSTPAQLAGLAAIVNGTAPATTQDSFFGKTIFLGANIDLTNDEWTPIGGASALWNGVPTTTNYFSGVFDGAGYTVTGLSVTNITPLYGAYGLFGYVQGGTLQNLIVSDAGSSAPTGVRTGASANAVAAVVGYTTGSLYNVTNNAKVTVNGATASETGGVVGAVDTQGGGGNVSGSSGATAYIQFCVNTAAINGRSRLGGVVGAAYCPIDGGVLIDQSFNTGAITAAGGSGRAYVGGVVGYDEGYIQNSYNTGAVSAPNSTYFYVGGIAGLLNGASEPAASLSASFNTGSVTLVPPPSTQPLNLEPLYAYADDSAYVAVSDSVYLDSLTQNQLGATETNVVAVSAATMGSTSTLPGGLSATYFAPGNPNPTLLWQNGGIGILGPIYVDPAATGSSPDGTITNPYNNLTAALAVQSIYRSTIYLVSPLNATQFPSTINMTVPNARIARGNSNTGDLFTLASGQTLSFTGGVIEGQATGPLPVTGSLVNVNGGTLTVGTGASLKSNNTTANGGAVNVQNSGTFILNGGAVVGNNAVNGGGIYVISGTVNLNSGTVSSNDGQAGGGIYSDVGGTVTIGTTAIDKNFSWSGGGIDVVGGSVTLANGAITANYAYSGNGVYVNGGIFTMNGGNITGNVPQLAYIAAIEGNSNIDPEATNGGGIYVAAGTFTLTGGTISGNVASSNGAGVYLAGGAFNITPATAITLTDEIFLVSPLTIGVGASLAPAGLLSVRVATPTAGTIVAQGVGGYTLTTDDIRHITYAGYDGWYTTLSGNNAVLSFEGSGVYLDGVYGSDSNAGTDRNAPVQTLAAALNALSTSGFSTIYVLDTVTVSGPVNDSGAASNYALIRSAKNYNPLFDVVSGGTLTLSTVGLDGNYWHNYANASSLIVVENGGILTTNGTGAGLINNQATNGGGVYLATGATFNLYAGKIALNYAMNGSGIYVEASGSLNIAPSSADTITFGPNDDIYLPASVTFNIGADLGTGVAESVPLTFASPAVDADVAYVNDATYTATSAAKLVSGTIVFDADGTAIYIAALQKQI